MRRAQIASAAAAEVAVDAGVACGPATASADDGAGAATVDGDSVVEPEAVAVSGDTDALGATGAFAGAACVEVSGVAFGVTGAAGAAGAAGVPGWGVPGLGVSIRLQMPKRACRQFFRVKFFKPNLNSRIPIPILCADLRNVTWPSFDDRHRIRDAFLIEDLGHADLPSNKPF